ncbi:MAG: iron-containing alcohol dehydrogenase [Sedimentibacter sp.]|nr:iron-containing alcohol dehydrogenase [Sedimentibacter sp.]HNZ83571.1 iron-containing alcohol dehydrogenase [Sedimentibacter sp.]
MFEVFCRIYQFIMKISANFMPFRVPELLEGENSLKKLPGTIKEKGISNVLIVTGSHISSMGLINNLLEGLNEKNIKYAIYNKTTPNPTIDNIEEALLVYKQNKCEGIVAFGGGSPMDCAKGIAARVARPNKTIPQMKGLLKVHKRIPFLFAVPTTAGTGSETTVAAVVRDSTTNEKYSITDMSLIPHVAVLDPALTLNLPPHITASTGMDALCHAVEAYIGRSNTKDTYAYARKAIKLIFDNLYEAYSNGSNIEARAKMQKASFYAGLAFTRAYVGYVHAIAHTLGGFYSMPHGLANAVIMPYVFEFYGNNAGKALAELADLIEIGEINDSQEEKTGKFIDAIKNLNKSMDIPDKISGIKEEDIPTMAQRAFKEANPLYPVPRIMTKEDIISIYYKIKEG